MSLKMLESMLHFNVYQTKKNHENRCMDAYVIIVFHRQQRTNLFFIIQFNSSIQNRYRLFHPFYVIFDHFSMMNLANGQVSAST